MAHSARSSLAVASPHIQDEPRSPQTAAPTTTTTHAIQRGSFLTPISPGMESHTQRGINSGGGSTLLEPGSPAPRITSQLNTPASQRRGAAFGTSSFTVPASQPGTSRLTARSETTGDEVEVKESTLLVIWRFIIKLKRKVAGLVKGLQKKSTEIHRMLVSRFPILSRVSPVLMQQLCIKAQKKLFQRKYTLIQQGCVSEWIYIVHSGRLAIYQQSEHVLATSGGMSIGINHETPSGATAALSLAATSKKFESLHIADVTEGDEVGLYGLLRPPTIVLMERRRKKDVKKEDSDSSSEEEKDGKDASAAAAEQRRRAKHKYKFSTTGGSGGDDDYRGGYIQPHTVIANQPSIVYALSARLFRELLLSVPELYVEIREEMTNKYLVRLKRFELWEIQRMKLQKIKQIQHTLIGSQAFQMKKNQALMSDNNITSLKPGHHHTSSLLDLPALKSVFEQAEQLVSRDSIADLFHGNKKMMSMSALTAVPDDADGEGEGNEDELGQPSFMPQALSSTEDVLISQWNEKQNGLLDELSCALSPDAPHHPAPNFHYTSILAQTGAIGTTHLRTPPIPYVDTRKLVGSRREFNFKPGLGPPAKHHMIPTTKPTASAAALASHAKEKALEQHMLLQQATNGGIHDPLASHLASGEELTKLERVYKLTVTTSSNGSTGQKEQFVQLSDGTYLTPEEQAYQKRLLKIQTKIARKQELQRTHEEEKFLEDILLVSKQVKEMSKKKPVTIAVPEGVGSTGRLQFGVGAAGKTPTLQQHKQNIFGSGSAQIQTSSNTIGTQGRSMMGSPVGGQIASPTSAAGASFRAHGPVESGVGSEAPSPNRSPMPSSRFSSPIRMGVQGSGAVEGGQISALSLPESAISSPVPSEKPLKDRNPFVTSPPPETDLQKRPAYERTTSMFGSGFSSEDSPGRGERGFLSNNNKTELPPENPAYANLPTLPSPQLKSLFSILSESGSTEPAMLLLNTVESNAGGKKFSPVPLIPLAPGEIGFAAQEAAAKKAAAEKLAKEKEQERANQQGKPQQLKRVHSTLLDLAPVQVKSRPVPVVSKYDLDAPFGSVAIPASFHSLAFHSFSDESWRGIARVPTPPLLPPTIEDPRKVAIRQGIERAQFRVKSRSRETTQAYQEFSRENKKSSIGFKQVALEADRRAATEALSLVNGSANQSQALQQKKSEPILASIADPLADLRTEARLSVLSMFSTHKAKELAHRERIKQQKRDAKEAKNRERKKKLHRSEEVRKAARAAFERDSSVGKQQKDRPTSLETGRSSSGSDNDGSDDGGGVSGTSDDDVGDEALDDEPSELAALVQRSPQHRSMQGGRSGGIAKNLPGFRDLGQPAVSPSNASSSSSTVPERSHLPKQHDTFLSAHHRLVLGRIAPGVSSSAQDPISEQILQEKREQKAHAKRLELLKKDKLKPAPGVDLETLKKQFAAGEGTKKQQSSSASRSASSSPTHARTPIQSLPPVSSINKTSAHSPTNHTSSLQPLHEEEKMDFDSSPTTPVSHGDSPGVLSPVVSPSRRLTKLGQSQSLPVFLDASQGVSQVAALVEVHQSSLSQMLSMSNKTPADLAQALPSMTAAFEEGGARGKIDPADRAVIEALTLPAHMVNASISDVADRLASMLKPFARGADVMAGRGIKIPDYAEGPTARRMLTDFQRGRLENSKRRVLQDAVKHYQKAQQHGASMDATQQLTAEMTVGGRHVEPKDRKKEAHEKAVAAAQAARNTAIQQAETQQQQQRLQQSRTSPLSPLSPSNSTGSLRSPTSSHASRHGSGSNQSLAELRAQLPPELNALPLHRIAYRTSISAGQGSLLAASKGVSALHGSAATAAHAGVSPALLAQFGGTSPTNGRQRSVAPSASLPALPIASAI